MLFDSSFDAEEDDDVAGTDGAKETAQESIIPESSSEAIEV